MTRYAECLMVEMLGKGNDSRYNFKIIRNIINYSNFKFVILSSFNIDRLSCWYSIFTKIGTFYDCRIDLKSQSQTLVKNKVLERGKWVQLWKPKPVSPIGIIECKNIEVGRSIIMNVDPSVTSNSKINQVSPSCWWKLWMINS